MDPESKEETLFTNLLYLLINPEHFIVFECRETKTKLTTVVRPRSWRQQALENLEACFVFIIIIIIIIINSEWHRVLFPQWLLKFAANHTSSACL